MFISLYSFLLYFITFTFLFFTYIAKGFFGGTGFCPRVIHSPSTLLQARKSHRVSAYRIKSEWCLVLHHFQAPKPFLIHVCFRSLLSFQHQMPILTKMWAFLLLGIILGNYSADIFLKSPRWPQKKKKKTNKEV